MCFNQFYKTWVDQLHQLVHQLTLSRKPTTTITEQHRDIHHLLNRVMSHYTEYYRVKSLAAKNDVLLFFSAPWSTSLERSLHWIAGWRPTTAFHLVYTESSILFESHIVDILRGLRTGDLGDLSSDQFRRVSELQCQTVQEENTITDELSDWQDGGSDVFKMSLNLDENIERLVTILDKADALRLMTIRRVVELLTPQQAVEFLIAAAQLQFGIRGWGTDRDRQRGNS